jgi:hypothetical protein
VRHDRPACVYLLTSVSVRGSHGLIVQVQLRGALLANTIKLEA